MDSKDRLVSYYDFNLHSVKQIHVCLWRSRLSLLQVVIRNMSKGYEILRTPLVTEEQQGLPGSCWWLGTTRICQPCLGEAGQLSFSAYWNGALQFAQGKATQFALVAEQSDDASWPFLSFNNNKTRNQVDSSQFYFSMLYEHETHLHPDEGLIKEALARLHRHRNEG